MKNINRNVIITGASEGIGLASAKMLLSNGCRVTLMGRSDEKMDNAIRALLTHDNIHQEQLHFVIGDVCSPESRQRLIDESIDKFGEPEILVNNVGGGTSNRLIEDIDDNDLRLSIEVNLESTFSLTRDVVPYMKNLHFGRIVNIASVAGRDAGRLSGPQYAAAKAGLIGMSRHLARDLGPFGITVNSIAPGFVATDRALNKWQHRSQTEKDYMMENLPIKRFGTPDEIAAAVYYFCQDLSGYTTGACLDINGGSYLA